MRKSAGPLLDRIDIHIEVPAVAFKELSAGAPPGTSSAQMREAVVTARTAQRDAFRRHGHAQQRPHAAPPASRHIASSTTSA